VKYNKYIKNGYFHGIKKVNKTLEHDLDLIIDLNPIFNQTIALELQIMKIIIL
jgi:hypothetical protein